MSNKIPHKKYKALMCDVDGTLIYNRQDGMPSTKVTQAISQASEKIHVGIATSRPLYALTHIIDHLQLSGPCIIAGGTQIVNGKTKEILWEKPLKVADYKRVCQILYKKKEKVFISTPDKDLEYAPNLYVEKALNVGLSEITPQMADQLITELAVISTIAAHKIPGYLPGRVWLEVTDIEATKQHGIFEMAKLLGIETKDIIGVGDGYNDFPLLMACGLKVAMGNAVDDIKAIADYIAPSVEEDGVVDVINKFILA